MTENEAESDDVFNSEINDYLPPRLKHIGRLNSSPNDHVQQERQNSSKDTTKDLSRSESMRLGATSLTGYRAFRPSEFVEEEILGNGFFASATKVYHKASGETMVSKRLHRYEGEERDCFLKEVKVLRSVRHKNVLRFIGVIYKGDCINLITEYVECGTLKEPELQLVAFRTL